MAAGRKGESIQADKENSAGYNILEMSLALLILSSALLLGSPLYRCLMQMREFDSYLYQDEIGIYQLQIALALGKNIKVEDDQLTYETLEHEYVVSLVNHKLITQPGTLDYLHDISNLYFQLEDGIIYLNYSRKNRSYTFPIAYFYE